MPSSISFRLLTYSIYTAQLKQLRKFQNNVHVISCTQESFFTQDGSLQSSPTIYFTQCSHLCTVVDTVNALLNINNRHYYSHTPTDTPTDVQHHQTYNIHFSSYTHDVMGLQWLCQGFTTFLRTKVVGFSPVCSHLHRHFNSHFTGKPGLASCSLGSQTLVILILSILCSYDRPKLTVLTCHLKLNPTHSHTNCHVLCVI